MKEPQLKRTQSRARLLIGTSVVAVVATCAAACGSSSSGAQGGSNPSTGTTTGSGPSGTPIVGFYFGNPLTGPDDQAGITAATKAINAAGGIDGHPIEIQTCNDNNDVNQATACANKGVSSPALAFVDVGSTYGDAYDPAIEKAGMASLGLLLSTPADDKSPSAFAFNGGTFNTIVSSAAAVKLLNAKKIGVPYIGVPAGAQLPPFIKLTIAPLGGTVVGVQAIPITATDYSAYAAKEIAAKPDVVIDGQTADMYTQFIKAVRQQGDAGMKFFISTGVFDAGQLQSLFGNDPNLYLVDEYNHMSAGYQHFLSDMNTYNNSYPNRNDSAAGGWVSVYAFAQAVRALMAGGNAVPSRASVLSYMNKQTNFNVQDMFGKVGINFTKPNTAEGGALVRLDNDKIWLQKYAGNGKTTPIDNYKPFSLFNPNPQ
jgi:ABC-type branched-subunit amino acid transport system substrate-binding protein